MSFGSIKYTDEEFNEIQAALRKRLGADFVATRPGPGGQKLYYVEGWRVVQLANETFGFDGWGYHVTNMTVDFVDHQAGKFNVGVSATVKVTLKNGAFREDVGYGCVDGMRSKSQAVEKARKESITDGLKRAMKSFGNLLGNCLNDKEYLKYLSRIGKKQPESYASSSIADSNMSGLPNSSRSRRNGTSSDEGQSSVGGGFLSHSGRSNGSSNTNNTSTPLRCEIKTRNGRKPASSGTSSSEKPPPPKQNGAVKKSLSSVPEFDKEELSNILSQDSFGDFSQMEDSVLWEDVISNIDESALRKSGRSGSSSGNSKIQSGVSGETPDVAGSSITTRRSSGGGVKSSPRLNGSYNTKRRRVNIPGLTSETDP